MQHTQNDRLPIPLFHIYLIRSKWWQSFPRSANSNAGGDLTEEASQSGFMAFYKSTALHNAYEPMSYMLIFAKGPEVQNYM